MNAADGAAVSVSARTDVDQHRDGGDEQQAGLQTGVVAIVFLHVVLEAADQKRRAEHEQRIGDDRPGDRGLGPESYCPARNAAKAMSSSVRLPSVALSRPPIMSPGPRRHRSLWRGSASAANGTMAGDGEHEQKSPVCVSGLVNLSEENHRHERQQPQQRIAPYSHQGGNTSPCRLRASRHNAVMSAASCANR